MYLEYVTGLTNLVAEVELVAAELVVVGLEVICSIGMLSERPVEGII